MAQTLLTFELNRETDKAVREICRQLGIRKIDVAARDYAQKLGCLAGVTGFPREKGVCGAGAFSQEMIVFSGMNSTQLDIFLAEYSKTGLPEIGLKAIITVNNIFWTAETLYHTLKKEHLR